MFEKILERRKLRAEKIAEARASFLSWAEVSKSTGWKVYEEELEKEINNIKEQMFNNTELGPEELKRIQLALQVYKKVLMIPKKLESNAKGNK